MLAVNHDPAGERLRKKAAGLLHQLLYGVDLGRKLIRAGLVNRAGDAELVIEEAVELAHVDFVAVFQAEAGELGLGNRADKIAAAVLAGDRDAFGKGAGFESASIFQKVRKGFTGLHLKAHGAFYEPGSLDYHLVCGEQDDVPFLEADVACGAAVHQIVVDVDRASDLTAARHLDVPEGTDSAGAAGHVQGVEHGGKGGNTVGAGMLDVVEDIHLDGADLPEAEPDVGAGGAPVETRIDAGELPLEIGVGLVYRHAVQVDWAEDVDIDAAFGRDDAAQGALVGSEDIDDDFVAGAEPVVAGRGQILAGSETEVAVAEDAPAVNGIGFIGGDGRGSGLRFRERVRTGNFLNLGFSLVLALVKGADPFGLGPVDPLEGKVGKHVFTGFAFLDAGFNIVQHLLVGHGALCKSRETRHEKAGRQSHDFLMDYVHSLFLSVVLSKMQI